MELRFQQQHHQSQHRSDEEKEQGTGFTLWHGQEDFQQKSVGHLKTHQHKGSGSDLVFLPPEPGKESRRLVVAVSNDQRGNAFLDMLRDTQERLGFRFVGTLAEVLANYEVSGAERADELADKFAFLEIRPGFDFPVVNSILRNGCELAANAMANVDVEGDLPMKYLTQGLGPNYVLRSSGSSHNSYLNQLNVSSGRAAKGIKIAVVDSGFETTGIVGGFLDLVDKYNKTEKDNFGHGTAMTTIIADVANGADVFSVRASDQGPKVSDAILGVSAASLHFEADIINLSFGLPLAQTCNVCGSTGGVSRVLHRLLRSISEKPMASGEPPILVAATGNDFRTTGFDPPAEWTFTVAVGAINSSLDRSSFSNYGTTGHSQYIMMPGGEESGGAASEWIGEATQKCYGTSPAAAYASGILALYMADPAYSGQSRSSFLSQVLANCKPCNNQNATEHGLGYLPYV
jgi:Subtilase family